jgi:hypothetical protein
MAHLMAGLLFHAAAQVRAAVSDLLVELQEAKNGKSSERVKKPHGSEISGCDTRSNVYSPVERFMVNIQSGNWAWIQQC